MDQNLNNVPNFQDYADRAMDPNTAGFSSILKLSYLISQKQKLQRQLRQVRQTNQILQSTSLQLSKQDNPALNRLIRKNEELQRQNQRLQQQNKQLRANMLIQIQVGSENIKQYEEVCQNYKQKIHELHYSLYEKQQNLQNIQRQYLRKYKCQKCLLLNNYNKYVLKIPEINNQTYQEIVAQMEAQFRKCTQRILELQVDNQELRDTNETMNAQIQQLNGICKQFESMSNSGSTQSLNGRNLGSQSYYKPSSNNSSQDMSMKRSRSRRTSISYADFSSQDSHYMTSSITKMTKSSSQSIFKTLLNIGNYSKDSTQHKQDKIKQRDQSKHLTNRITALIIILRQKNNVIEKLSEQIRKQNKRIQTNQREIKLLKESNIKYRKQYNKCLNNNKDYATNMRHSENQLRMDFGSCQQDQVQYGCHFMEGGSKNKQANKSAKFKSMQREKVKVSQPLKLQEQFSEIVNVKGTSKFKQLIQNESIFNNSLDWGNNNSINNQHLISLIQRQGSSRQQQLVMNGNVVQLGKTNNNNGSHSSRQNRLKRSFTYQFAITELDDVQQNLNQNLITKDGDEDENGDQHNSPLQDNLDDQSIQDQLVNISQDNRLSQYQNQPTNKQASQPAVQQNIKSAAGNKSRVFCILEENEDKNSGKDKQNINKLGKENKYCPDTKIISK